MADKPGQKGQKTGNGQAQVTDLTAVIAKRRAGAANTGGGRSLSQRLKGGDAPRGTVHPADAILRALDTKVEAEARSEARAEIDALANDVKLVSAGGSRGALIEAEPAPSIVDGLEPANQPGVPDQKPKLVPPMAAPNIAKPTAPEPKEEIKPAPAKAKPKGDWSWLGDAAMVAIAENKGKALISSSGERMPAPAAVPPAKASDSEAGILSEWAASNDSFEFLEELPDPEPIRLFDRSSSDRQRSDSETPHVYQKVIPRKPEPRTIFGLRPGTAYDEGDRREGLPIWLHLGLPIAAISAATLAIALYNLNKSDPSATADAGAATPDASARVEASVPPPAADPVETAPETIAPSPAETPTVQPPAPAPAPSEAVSSTAPAPEAVTTPAPSDPLPGVTIAPSNNGRVNTFVTPAVPGPIAAVPSIKPDTIPTASPAPIVSAEPTLEAPRRLAATPAGSRIETAALDRARPANRIPTRLFAGPIKPGSAAAALVDVANEAGSAPLSATEARWLARDLEKAFDTEIDGRSVSLKSKPGDWYRVTFENSYQDLREYDFERWRDMAPIPDFLVLEGGWFAAADETVLRATPSARGAFRRQPIEPGTLMERVGTFTDTYGDRWYLVKSDGVAVGYVSPADVVLAELYEGDIGLPLSITASTHTVIESRRVYTDCRSATIGPEGGYWQVIEACRDASGHWVSPAAGYVPPQSLVAGGEETIVLAAALPSVTAPVVADPIFAAEGIQERLDFALPYLPEGQRLTRTLTDGSNVTFTFGERFQKTKKVNLIRVDAVGRIDRPVKVDARWMRIAGGAQLRPTPSYVTEMMLGRIDNGQAVETIARATGNHGGEWVLVGRDGVGFGWVADQQLTPLSGTAAVHAVPNVREGQVAMDVVDSQVPCRTVDYVAATGLGGGVACQNPDGHWVFESHSENLALADARTTPVAAP